MDQVDALQENLSTLRKLAGWSAQDLAQMLGVSRATIVNLENLDRSKMSRMQYLAIRSLFGAHAEELREEREKIAEARRSVKSVRKKLKEACKAVETAEKDGSSSETDDGTSVKDSQLRNEIRKAVKKLGSVSKDLACLEFPPEKVIKDVSLICNQLTEFLEISSRNGGDKAICNRMQMQGGLRDVLKEIARKLKKMFERHKAFEQTLWIVDQAPEDPALSEVRNTVADATRGKTMGSAHLGIAASDALSTIGWPALLGSMVGSAISPLGAGLGATLGLMGGLFSAMSSTKHKETEVPEVRDPLAFAKTLTKKVCLRREDEQK